MGHHTFAFLLIFIGGGLGSMLRHAVNQASAAMLGLNFPYGTLFVNISGSLAMGLIAGWFAFRGEGGGQSFRLFLTTGILGGFTTFSTFSVFSVPRFAAGSLPPAPDAGMPTTHNASVRTITRVLPFIVWSFLQMGAWVPGAGGRPAGPMHPLYGAAWRMG